MKKIFTLLFAVGAISIASAQSRDFGHYKKPDVYSEKGNQGTVQKINREFDFKIATVKRNRHLNAWEKSKQIRSLEKQREQAISMSQFRFEKSHGQYNDKKMARNNAHRW